MVTTPNGDEPRQYLRGDEWTVQTSFYVEELGELVVASFALSEDERPQPFDLIRGYWLRSFLDDCGVDWQSSYAELRHGPGPRDLFDTDVFSAAAFDMLNFVGDEYLSRDNRVALAVALQIAPIPVFGSPPYDWSNLASKASQGSAGMVAVGTYANGHPVLAFAELGAVTLFWFVKPSARLARRSVTRRVAKKLNEEFRDDDER